MIIFSGNVPCKECGHTFEKIQLTGECEEAGNGQWWYRVSDGNTCPYCGELLLWMRGPAMTKYYVPGVVPEVELAK